MKFFTMLNLDKKNFFQYNIEKNEYYRTETQILELSNIKGSVIFLAEY